MVEDLFNKYNIKTSKTSIPQFIVEQINDDETIDFLSCMGTRIELHLSDYGVPITRLYCVDEIVIENNEEYNKTCLDNGYMIIGDGPNGDLLCINISTGLVGYAFHDDLWEENYDEFSDIYIELPFRIKEFLTHALENDDKYIYDGFLAEKFIENSKYD